MARVRTRHGQARVRGPYDLGAHWRRGTRWRVDVAAPGGIPVSSYFETKEVADAYAKCARDELVCQFGTRPPEPQPKSKHGLFYVVQLAPDVAPQRLKLGFATSIDSRVKGYRTLSPNCLVLGTWECERQDEQEAIRAITQSTRAARVGGEVYDCSDPHAVLRTADAHFAQLAETRRAG